VPLARHHHHIPGHGQPQRRSDRLLAVADAAKVSPLGAPRLAAAGGDFLHDGVQRLGARILRRDRDVIRQPPGHLPHPGAFGSIAQPGATKDHDDASCRQFARRAQGVLQRVGSVGEIDDGGEGLAVVDALHAPDHAAHREHAGADGLIVQS